MYYAAFPTDHEIWVEHYRYIMINPNLALRTQWAVSRAIIADFDNLLSGALPSEL